MHIPTSHSGRPRPLAPAILLALSLAACGGGSDGGGITPTPADPLASYKNQVIAWGSCQSYFSPDSDGPDMQLVQALGGRLQCADIKAPLDYQQPEGAHITLAMMRVLAPHAPEQKPHLLFNPGGPGGDGQKWSLYYERYLSNGRKETPLGDLYLEMSESYNFVGFSPRGVGASTRLECTGIERVYEVDNTRWGNTPENIQKFQDYSRYIAKNCQKNPVSAHIHTEATARDMDLMRHLLGDEKLHYYGISYGTWLGLWYAGLFPERVGPMVIDSSMNFNQSIHDASILSKEGEVHSFLNHSAPYAARHHAVFGLGTTVQEVVDQLRSLSHEVNWALLNSGVNFHADVNSIYTALVAVRLAVEIDKMIKQNKTLLEIKGELLARPYFADPQMNAVFRWMVEGGGDNPSILGQINYFRSPGFYSESKGFELKKPVWNAVVCNDEALMEPDGNYWVHKAFEMAGKLPIVNNDLVQQPCMYWQRQVPIQKPAMESLKKTPVLMVQTEFDVPTPLSGAMETFDLLPAASMVHVKNEGRHGVVVYGTQCVDATVMGYLLGRQPSQRLTQCQGKPLPLDAQSAQVAGQKSSHSSDQSVEPFQDADLARQLMQKLRAAL